MHQGPQHKRRGALNDLSNRSEGSEDSLDSQSPVLTQEHQEEIATREHRAVLCLRVIVLLVLVVSAVTVALSVFYYLTDAENDEFEKQFHSDASKVFETVGRNLDNTLGATDALVVSMISYARGNPFASWPFVTLPDFGIRATKVLKISKAFHLSICHLVEPELQVQWQDYTLKNHGWIDESVEAMSMDPDWHGPIVREYNVSYEIFAGAGPLKEPLPGQTNYLPSWQQAPMVPNSGAGFPYNWDGWVIPTFAEAYHHAFKTQKVTINKDFVGDIFNPNDPIERLVTEALWMWASSYVEPGRNVKEPSSAIAYPMLDTMETVRVDTDKKHPKVAFLTFTLFWSELFKDILPENSKGILLVMSHPCGHDGEQAITYQLDGAEVTYLGPRDMHSAKYDDMGYSIPLAELMNSADSKKGRDSSYTGLPLDGEYCPKTIKVYPSAQMEDEFKSSQPIIITLVATLIFVFCSTVFITYDLLVARRQKIVMGQAKASGAIVSSLFPEKVRNQLYEENKQKQKQLKNSEMYMGNGGKAAKPLATLYHETTIYFADLAGFTAWSSKRTPSQVFELLETLYEAFDEIAAKRGVFKVETIGDCYVAVTGIPDPEPDHAVIMVKFARGIMTKMNELTHQLVDSLGEDTASLEMRVGLHSGSTTAGVLRGAKGRFQLFGDTVNTASRMESNGVRGKIHVSQATAEALIASGKSHWLTEREDKITAKGKGLMTKYFVSSRSEKSFYTRSLVMSFSDDDNVDIDEEEKKHVSGVLVQPQDSVEEQGGDVSLRDQVKELEQRLANRLSQHTAGARSTNEEVFA